MRTPPGSGRADARTRRGRLVEYEFRAVWVVRAPVDAVFSVLADPATYASWWTEVRGLAPLDGARAELRIRAVLPYELSVVIEPRRVDGAAGILEASLSGDLHGVARWTVVGGPDVTRVVFEEEVVTTRPLLRSLAIVLRPLLRANHVVMMRSGRRGLVRFLAAAGDPSSA